MHRCRVLLTRAAKTIAAAEASSTTTTAAAAATKDASCKASSTPLPAAAAAAVTVASNTTSNSTAATSTVDAATAAAAAAATTPTTATTTSSSEPPPLVLPQHPIRSIPIPLYHHIQPNLFPPLQPGTLSYIAHHISSSMSATYNLCSSQEARDRFMLLTSPIAAATTTNYDNNDDDTTNTLKNDNGDTDAIIINTRVLGQSDMGLLKSLTLYHDLCHPVFSSSLEEEEEEEEKKGSALSSSSNNNHHHKQTINVRDFVMGCGWALEQFHRTKEEVLMKWLHIDLMETGGKDNASMMEDDNMEQVVVDDPSSSSSSSSGFYHYFVNTASKDPTSLEYDFIKMTTPEVFVTLQMEGIMRLLLLQQGKEGRGRKTIIPTTAAADDADATTSSLPKMQDIRVMNVALLSARVQEIYPPPSTQSSPPTLSSSDGEITKKLDSIDAPLEDDSLVEQQHTDGTKVQVVTQLEVLYELQQSSIEKQDMNDDNNNDRTTKRTKTSVMVGKFEACLEGDPNRCTDEDERYSNNTPSLRWKLASYRPAMEFYNTF